MLLIVQQGPGVPLIQDAGVFERRLHLETEGVVVYWDQRGTGKSFRADPSTINVARLAADVRAMVNALCARLKVERVDVLGLSIGGAYAMMAAAQDPTRIAHVVVVGLDVDWGESERYAYAFARNEAARRGARRAQRQLEAIGAPPHDTAKKFLTRARWVGAYGGLNRKRGFFALLWDTVWRVLRSPHYALRERVQALRAISKTQELMLASGQPLRPPRDGPARRDPDRVLPGAPRRRHEPRGGRSLRGQPRGASRQIDRVVREQRAHALLRGARPLPPGPSPRAGHGAVAAPHPRRRIEKDESGRGESRDPCRAAAQLMVDEGGTASQSVVPNTLSPFLSGFRPCVAASPAVRSRSIVGRLEASARRQFSSDATQGEIKMGRRLYVGNLRTTRTSWKLRDVFGKFGTVADAKVVMDRETGRPRGFAFVEMSSDQEAQAAIAELNGRELGGRALNVNEAQERSGGGGGGGRGGGGGGGGGGRGRW